MKTNVYVDGYNLYYAMLKGRVGFRWLNLHDLAQKVLTADCEVQNVNYYTADVSARISPTSPRDQHIYQNALRTIPFLNIHKGNFVVREKYMFLKQPLAFTPNVARNPDPIPRFAKVVNTEEKGSDVNLGAHLVRDALQGKFEHAAVITNDTDLKEPIRIVLQEANIPVTILTPVGRVAGSLKNILGVQIRHIRENHIKDSQFPDELEYHGKKIIKPAGW